MYGTSISEENGQFHLSIIFRYAKPISQLVQVMAVMLNDANIH